MALKREELMDRLKKLADSEPPKNLSPGAFCYSVMPYEIKRMPCPDCKRTMTVGEMDEILREYMVPLKRIQDHGVDATLIIPDHCPQCGYGLKKTKFFFIKTKFILAIKYQDRPDSIRVKLKSAFELEIMALFLQGKDRYIEMMGREKALKSMLPRLKKLFGVADVK